MDFDAATGMWTAVIALDPMNSHEMAQWIQQLWKIGAEGRYGYRMPGTPAGLQGARFILEKFREFGLQRAFLEQVDAPLCLPDVWRLEIRSGGRAEQVKCGFVRYAGFTPPDGIMAPIIYVGEGSEAQFRASDVTGNLAGKIVIVDLVAQGSAPLPQMLFSHDLQNTLADTGTMKDVAENWPIANLAQSYAHAKACGAAGYLGVLAFSAADNHQFHHWYADGSIPALTISSAAGAVLKAKLAAGSVEGSMVLTGIQRAGPISHVFASLPGRSPETIVVHTHHDGWAVNEASGAAVILALAKYFARFPQQSRQRTLPFVAFDSHFGKRPGKPHAWEQMLPKVVAAISIEMIAKHFVIKDGRYVDTGLVSPTVFGISQANPKLFSIVREAIVKHDLDRTGIVGSFFGDGNQYNQRGIPLIERIAHNAPQFSNDDTPDKVMVEVLVPTVAAFIDIIRRLDTVAVEEICSVRPVGRPAS